MKFYQNESLLEYKKNNLQIKESWKTRYFVDEVKSYLNSSVEKVLAVSGLRGTGKTTGILQAAENKDTCYVTSQIGEKEEGKDYIKLLQDIKQKNIILDEYTWIKNREDLDRYLITEVQNGKRIVITGTESISLDFLNYGTINHRVSVLHTTMFSYDEYLNLYNLKHSKETCKRFLIEGGLFKDYSIKNFNSMKNYIEEAIIKNLSNYLQNDISEEMAKTLTYSVLYKAICPSNLSYVPTLRNSKVTVNNFLNKLGINTSIQINERQLHNVAEIFEQTGIIVKVKNFDKKSKIKEQYYITNPSLTCQLLLACYELNTVENSLLGYIFESCAMVQLATNKLENHDIYFFNSNYNKKGINQEIDIILLDKQKEFGYFFECKFREDTILSEDISLFNKDIYNTYFKNILIEGKYIIYNGNLDCKKMLSQKLIFTPLSKTLDNYFDFQGNWETISKLKTVKKSLKKEKENSKLIKTLNN